MPRPRPSSCGSRRVYRIAGLPWAKEAVDCLEHGKPSPLVVSRIRNSFEYTRRTARLTRAAKATAHTIDAASSRVAYATSRGTVDAWNYQSESLVRTFETGPGVKAVAFSSSGDLAVSQERTIVVLQPESTVSSAATVALERPGSGSDLLVFDSTGEKLAYADGNGEDLVLRDLEQQSNQSVGGRERSLYAAAFSRNGRLLAFSPDGAMLAAGWDDGRVILWKTTDDTMIFDPNAVSRHGRAHRGPGVLAGRLAAGECHTCQRGAVADGRSVWISREP